MSKIESLASIDEASDNSHPDSSQTNKVPVEPVDGDRRNGTAMQFKTCNVNLESTSNAVAPSATYHEASLLGREETPEDIGWTSDPNQMWDPMPVSPEEDAQVAAAYPPNMLSKLNVRNPVLAEHLVESRSSSEGAASFTAPASTQHKRREDHKRRSAGDLAAADRLTSFYHELPRAGARDFRSTSLQVGRTGAAGGVGRVSFEDVSPSTLARDRPSLFLDQHSEHALGKRKPSQLFTPEQLLQRVFNSMSANPQIALKEESFRSRIGKAFTRPAAENTGGGALNDAKLSQLMSSRNLKGNSASTKSLKERAAAEREFGPMEPPPPAAPSLLRTLSRSLSKREKVLEGEQKAQEEEEEDEVSCLQAHIIHPYSVFRRYWDVLIMAFLFYLCLVVPYRIAFQTEATGSFYIFDRFVDVVFVMDIGLNFITGYTVGSKVVLEPPLVAYNYLSTFFVIDLVSGIPLEYVAALAGTSDDGEGSGNVYRTSKIFKIFKLLRLLKLFRVLRMNRILSRLETQLSIKYGLLKCLKFGVVIMFSAHILACSYIYTALVEEERTSWLKNVCQSDPSGLHTECLIDTKYQHQYIAAIYWAITTMSTIGYGDITADTTTERLVTLVSMCIGASIFAYGITNMCTLVANLDSSDVSFRQTMDYLHEFFEFRGVPQHLRLRVRQYFHYKKNSAMLFEQEPFLLENLSAGLRREVLLFVNQDLIQCVPFLRNHPDERAVGETVEMLKREAFGPQEIIVRQGDWGFSMFFITHGNVQIFSEGRWLSCLVAGDMFGEVGLVFRIPRVATVVSTSFVDVYTMSRQNYEQVVQKNVDMVRSIVQLARSRLSESSKRKLRYVVNMITMCRALAGPHWKDRAQVRAERRQRQRPQGVSPLGKKSMSLPPVNPLKAAQASHDDESKLAHVEEEDLPVESPAAAHITSPKPPVIEAREPGSSTTITPSRLRFSLERDSQAAALSHPALGAKRPTVLQAVQSFGSLDTESPRSPETVPDDADYTRVIKSVHTNVFMNEILQIQNDLQKCLLALSAMALEVHNNPSTLEVRQNELLYQVATLMQKLHDTPCNRGKNSLIYDEDAAAAVTRSHTGAGSRSLSRSYQ